MKISLVLATINRSAELERFMQSLNEQTYRNHEVIIVDQNEDDRLITIIKKYQQVFPILHLRSERGLSRARNIGLKHVTGDIVAFPDDDCAYPPDLLRKVTEFFEAHPDIDGLTGRVVAEGGAVSSSRWDKRAGIVTPWNVWRRGISVSIFLRRKVIQTVGDFDPKLGVGAGTPWGSGEETELLIRAIRNGYLIYYEPKITVVHPQKELDQTSAMRAAAYGQGMGYVLRKHKYPLWFVLSSLIRPVGGSMIALFSLQWQLARYRWATFWGRARGWWGRH